MHRVRNPLSWFWPYLLAAGLIACWLCGCATTPRQAAYKTLATVAYSVDSAMKVYGAAVAAGKVTLPKRAEVTQLHNTYRASLRVAVLAAKGDYSAPAGADLVQLSQAVLTAVAQFQ